MPRKASSAKRNATAIPVPQQGHERRSSRRVSLNLDVAVPVLVYGPTGLIRGVARNISEGGMLIELPDLPGIGSRLEITFTGVPGSADAPEPVTLVGEVRHQVGWQHATRSGPRMLKGVGVRFLEKSELLEEILPEGTNTTFH